MIDVEKLPRAIEAERQLLGSLLLLPEVHSAVAGIVDEHDFFDLANRAVYSTIDRFLAAGSPISLPSLKIALKDHSELRDHIGGAAAYLLELGQEVASAADAEYYARIVHGAAFRRKAILGADAVIDAAMNYHTEEQVTMRKKCFACWIVRSHDGGMRQKSRRSTKARTYSTAKSWFLRGSDGRESRS
jgi:replicative DNA helicase